MSDNLQLSIPISQVEQLILSSTQAFILSISDLVPPIWHKILRERAEAHIAEQILTLRATLDEAIDNS